MGSSCSILNDTEFDIWVTHGVNKTALLATVGGVAAVFTGGIGLAGVAAGAGIGSSLGLAGGGAMILSEGGIIMGTAATTFAGLTATSWTVVGVISTTSASILSTTLGVSIDEAKKIKELVMEFKEKSQSIKPGQKYIWSGTLSLTKTVYVMNAKCQFDQRACWTGSTAESERTYTISKDFPLLSVKRND